jgi:hypothetical protein
MALRLADVSFSALAFPPLLAPSFPSATAAAFFSRTGSGIGADGSCPVVWAAMRAANELMFSASSSFFLLRRVGMAQLWTPRAENQAEIRWSGFKLIHYRKCRIHLVLPPVYFTENAYLPDPILNTAFPPSICRNVTPNARAAGVLPS